MKTLKLQAELRSDLGKSVSRRLRSEGKVPAVIYGGTETVNMTVTPMSVRGLVYSPEFQIVEIDVNGKTYRCIMKDLQFDVVTDELNHIDFLELVDDRKVIVDLPLNFTGQPQGVKDGGRLVIKLKTVKARTYPKHLVGQLDVNIDNLQLNGNVRVQDIVAENVELMNPARLPIASVVMTRALRQAESETAAEGKKKK